MPSFKTIQPNTGSIHVIDGDPNRVSEVVDIWTFARDTTTRDPNWKLEDTDSGD